MRIDSPVSIVPVPVGKRYRQHFLGDHVCCPVGNKVFCPTIGLFVSFHHSCLPVTPLNHVRFGQGRANARQENRKVKKEAGRQRIHTEHHKTFESEVLTPGRSCWGTLPRTAPLLRQRIFFFFFFCGFDVSQTKLRLGDTTGIQETASRHQPREEMQKKLRRKTIYNNLLCVGPVFFSKRNEKSRKIKKKKTIHCN